MERTNERSLIGGRVGLYELEQRTDFPGNMREAGKYVTPGLLRTFGREECSHWRRTHKRLRSGSPASTPANNVSVN
jgi:hypothetical protein